MRIGIDFKFTKIKSTICMRQEFDLRWRIFRVRDIHVGTNSGRANEILLCSNILHNLHLITLHCRQTEA